ncbi:threonine/serine exporter family protein [Ornithobacterium rhinotracheale]|uniref:threonine/serine exporter family protein n=1 Tax=Ornithobacterium rhinotracheale TaxID=28251 RepID=UPI004035FF4B
MEVFNILIDLSEKIFWAMWVAVGFAMLFNTPRRAMFATAILGGIGFTIKFVLLKTLMPNQLVVTSFLGAFTVGMLGVYCAHLVHTPPVVFTIPAVINMIPGKFGYQFMMGLINLVTEEDKQNIQPHDFMETFSNGLLTTFIVMALAFGIVAPVLLFNTKTVKNKNLNKVIKEKVLKR